MFLKIRKFKTKTVLVVTFAIIIALLVRFIFVSPLKSEFSSSTAIYDSKHKLLRLTLSADDKYRLWTPLDKISPLLKQAILLHEDKYFYSHFALNPASLCRAFYHTYIKRDRRLGGSTITMQLARLTHKINSRSIGGKISQIASAVMLEALHSKDEILEAYLNLVPFGRNIEGVGAASLIYFGKDAKALTPSEVIALSLIPQSPTRRSKNMDDDAKFALARKMLYQKLAAANPKIAGYETVVGASIDPRSIRDLPFIAPHYTDLVLSARENSHSITTSLDLDMQKLLERQIAAYIHANRGTGIENASALIIDTESMQVKGMAGSADFFNAAIEGQVNGTISKRSPGSALKPFVYALAIDQGIINPLSILKDTPYSVGAFSPENFDGQFAGPLHAKDALIRSRNVPAIWLSMKLANPSYYEFLKMAGVSGLKNESHYGPSIVIGGGGEVTMMEMLGLYAMLANGGVFKKIDVFGDGAPEKGMRLLSKEASFITLSMLKESPRPDERYEVEWAKDRFDVAWKTGTSYGFKDAWTVGVFGKYAMAVWVGNFDGESNPSFVGIRAAAPLFFRVVEALSAEGGYEVQKKIERPKDVASIEVCATSGWLPNKNCPRKKKTWFIPGKTNIEECTVHREVLVEAASGLRACYPFSVPVRSEVYEFWPSDVMKIFNDAGIPRRTPPPSSPQCSNDNFSEVGKAPEITSPQKGLTYVMRATKDGRDSIPLRATTDTDAKELYWFVNSSFVGKSGKDSSYLWRAIPGNHLIRAVDDLGRQDSADVKIAVVK